MTRIVLYGSNSVLLAGLASILNCQSDLQVIGSFLDEVSPSFLREFPADLLLIERSPDEDIWWLEQWMLTTDFKIAGILLTDSLRRFEIDEYLHLGFKGFLPRLIDADEIVAAINAVIAGLIVIHPELASFNSETAPAITPLPQLGISLTPREIEILQMLKAGLENKAIASTLQISKHTVKFHLSSIFSKLNVSSRTEAVTLGLRQGLISL